MHLANAYMHLAKLSRPLNRLDNHPDRSDLIAWLRQYGGDAWKPYRDDLGVPNSTGTTRGR